MEESLFPRDHSLTKGILKDYETAEFLEFSMNPATISDSKNNTFAIIESPGRSHPFIQWSNGGKRIVGFKLKFFRTENESEVRRKVRWLQSLQYPEYSSDGRLLAGPHKVLFLFGNTFGSDQKWIVESVQVQYGELWSKKLEPYSAEVDISLMEWNDNFVSYGSVRR